MATTVAMATTEYSGLFHTYVYDIHGNPISSTYVCMYVCSPLTGLFPPPTRPLPPKDASKETDKPNPWTELAKYKLAAEDELRKHKDLDHVILRPAIVYGLGECGGGGWVSGECFRWRLLTIFGGTRGYIQALPGGCKA